MEDERRMKRGFDWYLLEKWGDGETVPAEDSGLLHKRREAYRRFCKAIRGERVADVHTIRRWFGLNGLSKPNRETFFRLAFALKLTVGEAQEYLQRGLLAPGIQINDYQEFIYLYGLDNHLEYGECEDMVEAFEKRLSREMILKQENHTEKLWQFYEENKSLSPEEFLLWMDEHASMFKGYSKTTLDYFIALKDEIIGYIRCEAEEEVLFLLEGTGFYKWAKEAGIGEDEYPTEIRRYLHNEWRRRRPGLTPELYKSLCWHCHIAYGMELDHSAFLKEIYTSEYAVTKEHGAYTMSHKYLSQLLHVAEQKEKQIRLARQLAAADEEGERKKLRRQIGAQKHRYHLVHREDLLPLLHYVGQKKYMESIQEKMSDYNREEAREYFITFANTALTACRMVPISEEYELDSLLLHSFREEDMYSMADMMEELDRKGEDWNEG